jgi:hypothetical protein
MISRPRRIPALRIVRFFGMPVRLLSRRFRIFTGAYFFMPHSFVNVTPILRILFVLAMLEVPESVVGTLNKRPFL